tara:strand:+ start:953 stop:1738 length:786 start_codon:yes stop_codon:yes gene_type:complete
MILKQTQILKQQIGSLDSVEERLNLLKDKYKNKTACILAPGPSLKEHELNALHRILDRDDLVVLSIKQAYNFAETNTDFHILNTWNFDKVNGYDYNEDTIVFFGLSKSYVEQQMEKIAVKPSVCDLWIPITNPPFINETQTIQALRNYDVFWDLNTKMEMPWGKSIFYEQAIPLALHLGCRDIVTIGWDIGDPKLGENQGHSYSYDKINPIPANIKDIQEAIDSTKELYDWLQLNNINFRILSNTNPADDRFERISDLKGI